jgi:hypothetical protein
MKPIPITIALDRTSDALNAATQRLDSLAIKIADDNALIEQMLDALKKANNALGYDVPEVLSAIEKAEAR